MRVMPGGTVVTTPARVALERKEGRYGLRFEKDGYEIQRKLVDQRVSWWPQIPHLVLFPSGLGGTLIDAVTGGLFRLTPDHVHAELVPTATGLAPGTEEAQGASEEVEEAPTFSPLDPYAPRPPASGATPAPQTTP